MKYHIIILLCLCSTATGFSQEPDRPVRDPKSRRAELLKRFPKSDTDGDGVLSSRELAAHIKKQQSSPEMQARLKRMLKRFPDADADKDGKLSRDELRKLQTANQKQGTRRSRRGNAPKVVATVPDVAYGEHKLQRFDLWPVPDAKAPTPLVVFIHGGGFRGGDKSLLKQGTVETYHKAGVAVAAMNYRLTDSGPYPMQMHDAALGLQTIRHRAKEWNIDPERVVCFGGSAGAGISLWLAFHDDLAEPGSDDPIARQSTRVLAAGAMNGQSTYDIHTFRKWFEIPDLAKGGAMPAFYGIEPDASIDTPAVKALMKDASPISHLDSEDRASVYMTYSRPNSKVTRETKSAIWVHHVLLGIKLREAMEALGLECTVTAPDMPAEKSPYDSLEDFLISKATGKNKAK
ncbi:alpha/beta hydrolase fold domain-containing protein [uncultured Gimesia sp.]|uniref:alpha/beta hydrolase fold domain-containing protein n=1 Tax=uncultured Gimesia sp. TaxID=1678688 RepID=UPI0030D77FB9|tara:strand:- start:13389 stop:14600 length:1212 start_codon:yes stop_codon:yes gene_type:complete